MFNEQVSPDGQTVSSPPTGQERIMSTIKFDEMPTPTESLSLNDLAEDQVSKSWEGYAAKPEYKQFNKHDMIESLLKSDSSDPEQATGSAAQS